MSDGRKPCQRRGCKRTTKREYLMCAECWGLVPQKLQHAVYRTWRLYSREEPTRENLAAYEASCAAASDAANLAMKVAQ